MARPKKKKEDKDLVGRPSQSKIVVQAPVRKTTKEIQEELLLSLAKLP